MSAPTLKEALENLGAKIATEAARPLPPARCQARQYSDEMACRCGLRWDMNDPDPPRCPAQENPR